MKHLALLLLLACPSWGAYAYKRAITVPAASVTASLTDFPVLISGTYSWLATTANGGRLLNGSGYDMEIYSDSALTTPIPWQRVSHNLTTGAVQLYVKVTLSSSADTIIYVGMGDAGVTTDQSDADNTWDANYQGVYHMEENPESAAAADSSGNGYGLASSGTMLAEDLVAGKVGNSWDFDGTNDYAWISKASGANLNITGAFTLSAWINHVNSAPGANEGVFSIWWNYSGYTNKRQYGLFVTTGQAAHGYLSVDGTNNVNQSGSQDVVNANWWHVALVYVPSTSLTVYVNGASNGANTTSIPASLSSSTGMFALGMQMDPANGGYAFAGKIDEARVASVARSAEWLAAEYSSTNAPASFYSVGDEVENATTRRRAVVVGE